jgi:lipoprotein-releasing system permease protein
MYKLFLCLRYLRSRIIAYFAVLAVMLCVALMLIVVSVMNGFLHKIEMAAKGLFGDVVIQARTLSGLARYDEFIAEVAQKVPEVEAASPYIITYGILQVPGSDHRQTVEFAGIRLPERARVSDFRKGLFAQRDWPEPTFDPPIEKILGRLMQEIHVTERLLDRETPPGVRPALYDQQTMAGKLNYALLSQSYAVNQLRRAAPFQEQWPPIHRKLVEARAKPPAARDEKLIDELREQLLQLSKATQSDPNRAETGYRPPDNHVILSLGLPSLSFRTRQGETVRVICPGDNVKLMLIPLGRQWSATEAAPFANEVFTVVDDCRTDVSSIDSKVVYVPFDTLQRLNNMDIETGKDPNDIVRLARCSQIHLKVREALSDEESLRKVRGKVEDFWSDFHRRYPDAVQQGGTVDINTWREQQAPIVSNIERQRTLVVTMFGIISLVSVVLIFVIFYMIVFQKTKDIGVLKAVGASSGGVAQIFLAYGAAVGLVGSIMGIILGAIFVRNINPIQDWLDDTFGFRVWSREWFLFEKIPNEVDWTAALFIVVAAIIAGLVGALMPAIRAARMQPVEALRYE